MEKCKNCGSANIYEETSEGVLEADGKKMPFKVKIDVCKDCNYSEEKTNINYIKPSYLELNRRKTMFKGFRSGDRCPDCDSADLEIFVRDEYWTLGCANCKKEFEQILNK